MLFKKLISTALLVSVLSSGNIVYADDCYIGMPGHGEGKTHKIELTSQEWKNLSTELKSKGMKIVYKGRNSEGRYIYYLYAKDGDRRVDEKICLKCLGTQPPIPDPEIPLIPLPDPEEGKPTPETPDPELPDIELPPEIETPLPEVDENKPQLG